MSIYYAGEKLESNLNIFAENFSKNLESKSSKDNFISKEVRTKAENEDGYEVIIGTHTVTTPNITMEFTRIYRALLKTIVPLSIT